MNASLRNSVIACLAMLVATVAAPLYAQPVQTPTTQPSATAAARTSLLDIVPADAWALVVVNNLQQLDADVVQLTTKLGLPITIVPSGLLQMALGLSQGIDRTSQLGLVVLDKTKFGQLSPCPVIGIELPVAVFIPVTDFQQFLAGLAAEKTESAGLWKATIAGQSLLIARKDNYAVAALERKVLNALLGAKPASQAPKATLGKTLTDQTRKTLEACDAFTLVNVGAIVKAYMPMLRAMLPALEMMPPEMQASPQAAQIRQMHQAFKQLENLASQFRYIALAADLNDRGLNITGIAVCTPGSLFAKLASACTPTDKSLLSGLPAGQYIFALGALKCGQEYAKQLCETFMKPATEQMEALAKSLATSNPEQAQMFEEMARAQKRMFELIEQLAPMQRTASLAIYKRPEAGALSVIGIAGFTDAAKAWSLVKELVSVEVELLEAVPSERERADVKKFLECVTYTPAAETIDDAKVDTLLLDVTALIEKFAVPEADAASLISAVKAMFGTEGLKIRFAVTDRHIVATLGGGAEVIKQVLELLKKGASPLDSNASVVAGRKRLPAKRIAEMYFSVDNLLAAVNAISQQMTGAPLPLKFKPAGIPLAMSCSTGEGTYRIDVHVPVELAVEVKNAVMSAMMPPQPPAAVPTPEF